ncbi:MAG: CopG family transcriptional regulator [Chloroflexi bacterium]|nr:MAG: CopG family transcriptional regulator [Chloroflexota bacterium]
MATVSVKLTGELEERLNRLVEVTKRTKSFYMKEAITRYLDEMEDQLLQESAYDYPPKTKQKEPLTK